MATTNGACVVCRRKIMPINPFDKNPDANQPACVESLPLSPPTGWEINLWRALAAVGLLLSSWILLRYQQPATNLNFISGGDVVPGILALIAALVAAYPIFRNTLVSLFSQKSGGATDMLISIAVLAAMVQGEFTTAVVVALALDLGHIAEERGIRRAGAVIDSLVKLTSRTAHKLIDSTEIELPSDELVPGDTVVVYPGEVIPTDGKIKSGTTSIDPAHLTGESTPIDVGPDDDVFHGMINLTGRMEIKVTAIKSDTSLGRVIDALKQAELSRPPITRVLENYTSVLLPIAILVAASTFVITREASRAIAVLVVACPCALVLSSPAAMIPALAVAVKKGILVKGAAFLEQAAKLKTFILDKTGTITLGKLEIREFVPVEGVTEAEIKKAAEIAATGSIHPVAKAISKNSESRLIDSTNEVPGKGVEVSAGGKKYRLGRIEWVSDEKPLDSGLPERVKSHTGPSTWVSIDAKLVGAILLSDILRPDVEKMISEMRKIGIERLVLVTGDKKEVAEELASDFDFDRIEAEILPEGKADIVDEEILKLREKYGRDAGVMFVGDGVNDALAISKSDVGVAMGAMGSEVALKSANIALMTNDLLLLPYLVRLAKKVNSVIVMNVFISIIFAIVLLILAITGILPPMPAAIIHQSASAIIIANGLRLLATED